MVPKEGSEVRIRAHTFNPIQIRKKRLRARIRGPYFKLKAVWPPCRALGLHSEGSDLAPTLLMDMAAAINLGVHFLGVLRIKALLSWV